MVATAESLQLAAPHVDDDDAAPPLNNLPDQMHAVQLADSIIGTAGLKAEGELRTAAVTDSSGKEEPSCLPAAQKPKPAAAAAAAKQPFKKGFLDARPRSNTSSKQVLSSISSKQQGRRSASSSSQQQHVPLIKPQQQQQAGSGKAVPDMFMLPPDRQQQRLVAMKAQLLSALQPTPDTVSAVAQDSTLMSGFEDAEVMAAVAEVARDPQAFAKHAHNPKVQKFYQSMGSLVGARLEKMGQQQPKSV